VSSAAPRVSIVIPAYNEGDAIIGGLERIVAAVSLDYELLVVVDSADDTTVPVVKAFSRTHPQVRIVINEYGRGPAHAIRYGIDQAAARTTVVTMADGCDDPRQIDDLARSAGRSLYTFAGVGTRDATNSYKAYNTAFVRQVGIESRDGFEIGLELTAKARRRRMPVAEIPTIWLDRAFGVSNFKMTKWIPKYLRWYFYAFGRRQPAVKLES